MWITYSLLLTFRIAIMAPGVYNLAAISLISKLTGTDLGCAGDALGAGGFDLAPAACAEPVLDSEDFSSLNLACAIFYSLSRRLSVTLSSVIFFSMSAFCSCES